MKKLYLKIIGFVCLLLFGHTKAQLTTYTFAGNGTPGYSGDGGSANQAQLNYPYGLARDPAGNVYIGEDWNYRVRIVNTFNVINTDAGNGTSGFSGDGGPSIGARLNFPSGIAPVTGAYYISDWYNNRIRKVTTGTITTIAGNGIYAYSGDGGPATSASLKSPSGIVVDGAGNIYFTEYNNHILRKVTPTGTIMTVAGTGTAGYSGDGGLATNAQLSFPHGVAIDASGNIYIVDGSNHCIRKINTSGIISTVAGNGTQGYSGDGGLATSAQFNTPQGICLDGSGNIFVSDMANNAIREINSMGIISTVMGTPWWGGIPLGIVNDGAGNILYCSAQGHVVVGFQCPTPTVTIANSNSVICSGQSSTLTVSGANTYYWSNTSTSSTLVVSPTVTTTYSLTSMNYIGCSDVSAVTVSVSTCTGIEESKKSEAVLIYPNPCNGILNVKLNESSNICSIKIFNSLGEEISNKKIEIKKEQIQMDLSDHPDGIYFIEIIGSSGSERIKFIKE